MAALERPAFTRLRNQLLQLQPAPFECADACRGLRRNCTVASGKQGCRTRRTAGGGGERGKKAHRNSDTPAGLKIAPRITTASQIVIVVGRHHGSLHDTRDGNQRQIDPTDTSPPLLGEEAPQHHWSNACSSPTPTPSFAPASASAPAPTPSSEAATARQPAPAPAPPAAPAPAPAPARAPAHLR